jgi:hypothetical protein
MRVLGNYYFFVRDEATWRHVEPSALSFCKHTTADLDLVLWDNESDPDYASRLREIFASRPWRSLDYRIVEKRPGGPGIGSLTQRVQREIWKHAVRHRRNYDVFFTQEDDYWFSPQWVEKALAVFAQHPDVMVLNPIDGPFLHVDCTRGAWVAPVLNPVVDGVVVPTMFKGKPLFLLDQTRPPRRVAFPGADFKIRFARHIDGSNWYRTSMLEPHAAGIFDVIDHSYAGWEHYYDWCWPDFAIAEWLYDHGLPIACPQPSLHQHRTRPGKGEYSSPTFPRIHERV